MNSTEAEQILDWLTGAFGKRLADNERSVWLSTLCEMESGRAMEIALQFGKNGERFPTVPDFRRAMRIIQPDESWRGLSAEPLPIPEFASIWYWSICTRKDHRPFPQFYPLPDDAMTMAEYEVVRQEWKDAGAPQIKSVSQLVKAMS